MIRARYRRIVTFFARLIASFIFWDLILPRVGLSKLAARNRPQRFERSAHTFRTLAIDMGGVMIKVGQFLSTRVDVLPEEVTLELAGLQDEIPPAPFAAMRAMVEAEFGQPLAALYADFSAEPLAAASLGQAHLATLLPEAARELGFASVVVKVQRPHIEEIIATDLAALNTVGRWLMRYGPIRRRADVPGLLAEFTSILYEEIDYLAEGRNAETFAANFIQDTGVRVPKVIWSRVTQRVLTLENVLAIKITDYAAITAAEIDRGDVAKRLISTYFKQIFEDGFFHADPHPGNLFVDPTAPTGWQLTFIDFGMVGRISTRTRQGLREMLIGVGTQNPNLVVQSYKTLGVLLPNADVTLIEQAGARLFERFWGKNMGELRDISFDEILALKYEFRQLLYDLPFQIPQDLIFLGRAVGILSGMCTGLDPSFNLWEHLVPYAGKIVAEEARAAREPLLNELLSLGRSMIAAPRKLEGLITKLERGEIGVQAPEVTRQGVRIERALNRVGVSVIGAALLLAGTQWALAGETIIGGALLGLAGFLFLSVVLRRG
jgi:predicted unusual protein kinase regulating ubiquinone biosynthesis (AarF/ABC1/UbiB family)